MERELGCRAQNQEKVVASSGGWINVMLTNKFKWKGEKKGPPFVFTFLGGKGIVL